MSGAAGPSPPPTSIPCAAQQARLDRLAVDALGDAHGRERRELVRGVGEQLEPALGDAALQVLAGLRVARPARLEALPSSASLAAPRGARRCAGSARCGGRRAAGRSSSLE